MGSSWIYGERVMKIVLWFVINLLFMCHAYAGMIECPKLKGSMLNNNQYEDINFESDTTIFQYNNQEGVILSGEEKDTCKVIENNNDFVTCINVSNGITNVNLWTYYKKDKKIYYSKHGFTLSQYSAICSEK